MANDSDDALSDAKVGQPAGVASSRRDVTQSMLVPGLEIPVSDGSLIDRVSSLIEQTRSIVAKQANSALTLMNWHIG